MVKIPRATPGTTKLSTAAPASKIGKDAFTGTARAIQQSGKQLNQLADKFRDMRDLKQSTEATTIAEQKMLELRTTLATDTDFDTVEVRHSEQLRKIREEAAAGIVNPRIRQQFIAKQTGSMNREMFRVTTHANEGKIKEAQAVMLSKIESTRDMLIQAETPEERDGHRAEIKGLVQSYVDLGALGPEQGKLLVEKTLEELRIDEVDYDIRTRPDFAFEMLSGPEQLPDGPGRAAAFARNQAREKTYPDLTPDERKEKQKEALSAIKWAADEAKLRIAEDMNLNEDALYNDYKAGTLTEDQIMDAELLGALKRKGGISKGMATALRKAKKPTFDERQPWEVADMETKLGILYDGLGLSEKNGKLTFKGRNNTLQDLQDFREAVVTAKADGFITASRETTLLKKVEKFFDRKFEDVARRRIEQERNVWKKIGGLFAYTSPILYNMDQFGLFNERPGLSRRVGPGGQSRTDMAITQIRDLVDKKLEVIQGDISSKQANEIVEEVRDSHWANVFPSLLATPGATVAADDVKAHAVYNPETGKLEFN
jgi:hypothetical protein